MPRQNLYPFYPNQIFYGGFFCLVGAFILAEISLWVTARSDRDVVVEKLGSGLEVTKPKELFFSLGEESHFVPLPLPKIESELIFSQNPTPPESNQKEIDFTLRLKKSNFGKKISFPCRIDLQYGENRQLEFSEEKSLFYVELSQVGDKEIECVVRIEGSDDKELFIKPIQEVPIKGAKEFAEGSPLRILADAKWMGRNLFVEKYGSGRSLHSFSIDGVSLELKEGDLVSWKGNRWILETEPDNLTSKTMKLSKIDGKTALIEGWDGKEFVRIAIPITPLSSLKMRPEEIITALRARSERQISCMLDKQCFILKCGDWILKANGKWKVLRTKEERESYLAGRLLGELLVFEKIEVRQGQKYVLGSLFNVEKTEILPIHLSTGQQQHSRKSKGKAS